ncbi:hypothetical protein LDENG_00213250 [Lucifuga dentata]|nr:hypothetical protein LDENG_00213250 [Lucifuga dentata]
MSSANIIVQGDSCLTSSVSLSITTANKKGLRADPWCSPTSTLNSSVTPTAHLTTVLQLSYMSCTTLTYFSATPEWQRSMSDALPDTTLCIYSGLGPTQGGHWLVPS